MGNVEKPLDTAHQCKSKGRYQEKSTASDAEDDQLSYSHDPTGRLDGSTVGTMAQSASHRPGGVLMGLRRKTARSIIGKPPRAPSR